MIPWWFTELRKRLSFRQARSNTCTNETSGRLRKEEDRRPDVKNNSEANDQNYHDDCSSNASHWQSCHSSDGRKHIDNTVSINHDSTRDVPIVLGPTEQTVPKSGRRSMLDFLQKEEPQ